MLGGWITDNFSWRWLFYINLPLGIVALTFVILYMHLPHVPREHSVDYVGFSTLGLGLTAALLATSWGGTQYPWGSWEIITLYAASAVILGIFLFNESRVKEPVIPLYLWKNSIFAFSVVANLAISMGMFGAIYYIPVFAQGVLGVSVTGSGTITIPLTASMILTSIVVGRLITRTGRYKAFILAGPIVMAIGYLLLTRLGYDSTENQVRLYLVVVGLGLGALLQTYTLIVQNAVTREDLGVATATAQFSRSAGATIGIAVFGTILTSRLQTEIPKHLPPGASQRAGKLSGGGGLSSVLDPSALSKLPNAVATGIREGLAASMHPVFLAGIPIIIVAFIASLFIKELPLRTKAFADEAGPAAETGGVARNGTVGGGNSVLLGGIAIEYLARRIETANGDYPNLISAASELVPEDGAPPKDRARTAAREVLRPLAAQLMLANLPRNGRGEAANGTEPSNQVQGEQV